MTLQDFINKYQGETVGDGECGTLVRAYCIEVQGYTPPSHPSAKDYWTYGLPGYDKVSDPQDGDIAVYDGHGVYTDGHIAIVCDGGVFEQNADPDGSSAHIFNRANTYLLGYLRKEDEMKYYPNQGDLVNIHNQNNGWPGHMPNANDVAFWCNGTDNPAWGNVNNVWTALVKDVGSYVSKTSTPQKAIKLTPGQLYQA